VVDGDGLLARRIGEVVEAASTSFVAQCYQLNSAPPLGSFVQTGSALVYGVVYRVATEPLDSNRPVLARGEGAATEEEVFKNNPQLARLFTTRFEALIAGHSVEGAFKHFLPPLPPGVHSFVYLCSPDEVAQFTTRLDFISLVLGSGLPVADDVAGACLRAAAAARTDGPDFLARASRALAAELASDVPRLNSILRRISP
jgi:hypothetical protein